MDYPKGINQKAMAMPRLIHRCLTGLIVSLIIALAASPAAAQDSPEDLVSNLGTGSYRDKADAVDALAASGAEYADGVLAALRNGDLYKAADGRVLIGRKSGGQQEFIDPLTGDVVEGVSPDTVDAVRVNNLLRKRIEDARAILALSSPDDDRRLAAAEAAFDAASADNLPLLTAQLQKEEDGDVRQALEEAIAVITLNDSAAPADDRLAAIATLRARGDQAARAKLSGAVADDDPAVAEAASRAVSAIDDMLAIWAGVQNMWYGLSLGSVLLLAAIGLAITFGVMGVINMAHGEMVMLGAYTTYVVQQVIAASAPGLMDVSLIIAVPAAFLVSGLVGIGIERSVIRFLYGRPLETLLATWGISLILQQAVRSLFGPTNKQVTGPSWMSGSFDLGNLVITWNRLVIILFALAIFGLLLFLMRRTFFGLQTRAVTQNRAMAAVMGIRTQWIDMLTFGLGSGIAGIAGVALSQIDNVSPNLGQSYIIDSFMVVVFGGASSMWGTMVGAATLGIANKFLEPYAGAVLAKILILVFIILFIQRKPRGLFALKGRAVDA